MKDDVRAVLQVKDKFLILWVWEGETDVDVNDTRIENCESVYILSRHIFEILCCS